MKWRKDDEFRFVHIEFLRKGEEKKEDMADRHSGILDSREMYGVPEVVAYGAAVAVMEASNSRTAVGGCGRPVHGHKAVWEDPVEWVRDTLPWPLAQQDQSKLLHLPPPSMGTSLSASPPREHLVKESPPSSLETDPLMAMLLKLQEAANYIESPDRETMCDSDLSSTI
ncbi:unnamed protein product [Ranitomeya imitator]|uniref:Uncharacterized protein n=1 Tax=Ranitomeya imitator TaxID=111125 RepID=A0ABN9LI86_9NEOB|nr:unnamed protein product [Ranitomeya imitator]